MAKHWHSGKSRINDLLWSKRKPAELAVEVNDETMEEVVGSPLLTEARSRQDTNNLLEKPNKKTKKK